MLAFVVYLMYDSRAVTLIAMKREVAACKAGNSVEQKSENLANRHLYIMVYQLR